MIILTPGHKYELAKFVRSDEDRALHDHPWNFFVLPIWRGYYEHSERRVGPQEIEQAERVYGMDGQLVRIVTLEGILRLLRIKRRVYPIISARYRKGEYRHRVELIDGKPSWSIFVRFRERRTWGFWPKEGFIAWNKWWQDKCE